MTQFGHIISTHYRIKSDGRFEFESSQVPTFKLWQVTVGPFWDSILADDRTCVPYVTEWSLVLLCIAISIYLMGSYECIRLFQNNVVTMISHRTGLFCCSQDKPFSHWDIWQTYKPVWTSIARRPASIAPWTSSRTSYQQQIICQCYSAHMHKKVNNGKEPEVCKIFTKLPLGLIHTAGSTMN